LTDAYKLEQSKVTDEELARYNYEQEAKNWPNPIGWDNLSKGAKAMWIAKAAKEKKRV
jgi:hypothetical protein